MNRILASVVCSFGLFCGQVSGYSGEMPKQVNYDYTYHAETTAAPKAYEFSNIFGSQELGIKEFGKLADMCTDPEGNIYLCDAGGGRVVKVDPDYKMLIEKTGFSFKGKELTLSEPEGISTGNDGFIYVADTGNGRVIKLDTSLNVKGVVEAPDKQQAQYDFEFMPSKVTVDGEGRMYVVAKSQTQGIFQFDAHGNFIGYIGASKVKASVQELFYRIFASRSQLKGSLKFIPTEYNNICIDSNGFIYGTISVINTSTVVSDVETHGNNAKMVRKMNQSGKDITVVNGNHAPLGDLDFTVSPLNIYAGPSKFVDVAVFDNGVYSVLDARRGRVFTYNSRSELMYMFGGRGEEKESMTTPVAIAYSGDKILIADSDDGTVRVFKPTDYAHLIMQGNAQYEKGDYDAEVKTWSELLKIYPGSELANVGMGRALYKQGKYSEALSCFKLAQNREYYSKALKYHIRNLGVKNAPFILGGIAVLVVGGIILAKVKRKKAPSDKKKVTTRFGKLLKEIKYGFYIMFHPFDGFWDLKSEKRGSVASATCILGMTVVANILYIRLTPFLFNTVDFTKKSALVKGALGIISMIVLWTVCNWALTTIMSGKGTFKDIYKYSCYSLLPIAVIYPILLLASYLLTMESATFLTLLSTLALVWVGFLLFCGTSTTHQYSGGKAILTMVLTVVGIMIILFVLLLTFSLVQQMFTFISLLFRELTLSV